jgi:hypothetical protein
MCASAIRWAGFRELVFGSRTQSLKTFNWHLMTLSAEGLFEYASELPTRTAILGGILANETDPYFAWQYSKGSECPPGCKMVGSECRAETIKGTKSEQDGAVGGYWDWLNWRG